MALTSEDLLAISQLLDVKLDSKLESVLESKLESKLQPIRDDIRLLKLQNENDILPRLQNIEACYVSTYERYKSGYRTAGIHAGGYRYHEECHNAAQR